jgi:hypothetical protein
MEIRMGGQETGETENEGKGESDNAKDVGEDSSQGK